MRLLALSALLATSVIAHAGLAQAMSGSAPPASTPAPAEPAPLTTPPAPAPNAVTAPSTPAPSTQPPVAIPAPPAVPTRQMTVESLEDKDLVGANAGEIGDIESVVESSTDKKRFVVISRGGFLGFFETEVAIPLENIVVRNDQVVLQGLTEEQLKALPKFENENNAYRVLSDSETISLTEVK